MTISASPEEVRIEHSVDDQKAMFRAFLWFYVVLLAVGFVLAAVFNPEMLLGVAGFAVLLVGWGWQMRRAQSDAEPWVLVLTRHELRHTWEGSDTLLNRGQVGAVRVKERSAGRSRVQVLEARDHDGAPLLATSLPGRDAATMLEAAIEEWGWPTG